MRDEDVDLLGVYLELLDWDLRCRYPKLFRHVDRIKRRAGWTPHRHGMRQNQPFSSVRDTVFECLWCGDNFTADKPNRQYCTRHCWQEMKRFRCSR